MTLFLLTSPPFDNLNLAEKFLNKTPEFAFILIFSIIGFKFFSLLIDKHTSVLREERKAYTTSMENMYKTSVENSSRITKALEETHIMLGRNTEALNTTVRLIEKHETLIQKSAERLEKLGLNGK